MSDSGFAAAFGRYAAAVARRYPWIDTYLPVNEPLTTARFAGLYGLWHPNERSERSFIQLLLAQCLAIREAMRAIRGVRPDARLVVNDDVGRTFGPSRLSAVVDFLNERRWLTWDLLCGLVDEHHPMWPMLAESPDARATLRDLLERPCPPDLVGVDHYVTSDRYVDDRIDSFSPHLRPSADSPAYVDVEAVRIAGLPSGGMERAIHDTWDRYRRPIALTEVSLTGEPEDEAAWWMDAWTAAVKARETGVDLVSVTAWAIVGSSGWDSLLCADTCEYAPGCFDVRATPPSPRPVAYAVRARALGDEKIASDHIGWWRRPERGLVATARALDRPPPMATA
jgi:dTDP-4-dehydrorhamnose reductase